jgi:hypothetical protein
VGDSGKMIRAIPSTRDTCINCGSHDLDAPGETFTNTTTCNDCGVWMVVQQEEDPEESQVVASYVTCPHCRTLDEIRSAGADEWCSNCTLDPNRVNYSSKELARLWLPGSGIRKFMEKDSPRVSSPLYRFLTRYCGPHCSVSEECTQSTEDFVRCRGIIVEQSNDPFFLNVENLSGDVGEWIEVGPMEEPIATLSYASGGWYGRITRLQNETNDKKGHTNTGS